MARPNKIGLNYYNCDTDRYQDMKIKRLKKNFSCTGLAIYDYILNEVYRVKGCFLVWDEDTAFDVADYFGIKESVVKEVVNYCGNVGLFEKELLTRDNAITSNAIQERYMKICQLAGRTNFSIPKKINLLTPKKTEFTPEETKLTTEETKFPPPKSTQSKVKESKGKERKVNKGVFDFEKNKEFLKMVCDYFSQKGEEREMKVFSFLKSLSNKNILEDFKKQTEAYITYKKQTGEITHGWLSYKTDWNTTDWTHKLSKIKNIKKEMDNVVIEKIRQYD